MKCKEVRRYFKKSIENKTVLEHLNSCEACKKEYGDFLALTNILSKGCVPEKNKYFWKKYIDEIENKLKNIPHKKEKKIIEKIMLPVFMGQPVYTAAVLILLTGILTYYKWSGDEKDVYSNSLEFFLEEFDNVVCENVFAESIPFDEEDLKFYINSQTDIKNE